MAIHYRFIGALTLGLRVALTVCRLVDCDWALTFGRHATFHMTAQRDRLFRSYRRSKERILELANLLS